jgi:hypothetical protein
MEDEEPGDIGAVSLRASRELTAVKGQKHQIVHFRGSELVKATEGR